MPEYLSPGVYVEEVSTGPKPIEGVSTSVAGFVGPTERGPEEIRYITSYLEFSRWYGGHLGVDKSFMSYAVQGFFDNGGKRCYVGRIVGGGPAPGPGPAASPVPATLPPAVGSNVTFIAYGRGVWGNRLFVRVVESSKSKVAAAGDAAKGWVRVQVLYFSGSDAITPATIADPFDPTKANNKTLRRPDMVEDFDDLALSLTAANSLVTVVNLGSRLIRLSVPTSTAPLLPPPAAAPLFAPLTGGVGAEPTTLAEYQGALASINGDVEQLLGYGSGLEAMDTVDGVSLLMAPDHVHPNFPSAANLTTELITRCEKLKDRFAILSTIRGFNPLAPQLPDTTYAAIYHPWIWVYDPFTRDDQLVPPTGHMAGIIAKTDLEQGVFKAPANAVVMGAKELESPLPKALQDVLNPIGVNCIRDFRSDSRGIRLWGARTLSSDPEWKYINVRRLFLYVEESIDEGTQWVVFEGNNEVTWGRVQRSVSNFLMTIWRAGGLFGSKPEEAFFVRCDRTTMDEDDIQNGRLICQIGICPVRPAEFVIFRIGQKTADATA